MLSYILQRLVTLVLVMIGVSAVIFVIMHLTPGDPALIALGPRATEEAYQQLREEWGLNLPLHEQYLRFLGGVVRGDLGESYATGAPVLLEIWTRFPATALLALASMFVAMTVGLTAGMVAAVRPHSWLNAATMLFTLLGVSTPVFLSGLLLIYLFSYQWPIFPTSGFGYGRHLVLPAVILGGYSAARIARMTRASMLEVLNEDYIRTARAKGLREWQVLIRHAVKLALIPVLTTMGLQLGALLNGAIIVETIFAWPGLGRLLIDAITLRDAAVIRGSVLFAAGFFVLANTLVDIGYTFLDPRIRYR